jgi:hypothetical protein
MSLCVLEKNESFKKYLHKKRRKKQSAVDLVFSGRRIILPEVDGPLEPLSVDPFQVVRGLRFRRVHSAVPPEKETRGRGKKL